MADAPENLRLWLLRLQVNPMKTLEDCKESYNRASATHNERLYESIGFIAAFTRHLNLDELALEEFRKHRFWKGNSRVASGKHNSILVVRFLLGASQAKGALYEQARSYTKVVDFFLDKKTEPSAIPGILRRETIYGLLDQLAKSGVKKAGVVSARNSSDGSDSSVSSNESDTNNVEDTSENDTDPEGGGEQDGSDVANKDTEASLPTKRKVEMPSRNLFTEHAKEVEEQGRMPVLVALKPRDWDNLERYLKKGQVKLICSGFVGDGGWVRVTCERVSRCTP